MEWALSVLFWTVFVYTVFDVYGYGTEKRKRICTVVFIFLYRTMLWVFSAGGMNKCPKCKNRNLSHTPLYKRAFFPYFRIKCSDCGHIWRYRI